MKSEEQIFKRIGAFYVRIGTCGMWEDANERD